LPALFVLRDAGKLFAIELGNEPDHWAIIAKKSFRPIPYTYDQYLAEYKAAENAILSSWPAGVPQVYFQGMRAIALLQERSL
jgi:hypothetical protein